MRKTLTAFLFTGLTAAPVFADEPVTIAALGDSLTQGYGLAPEQGFVPQLQTWLDAAGAEVRLINAGVSGDTTAGGAARVGWTLTPEVDAMIVALGANDVLRGIDPVSARANLVAILDAAQSAKIDVLLIGLRSPNNFGPDYKASFDAIYPELAQEYDTLYLDHFFVGITQDPSDLSAMQPYLQPDGLHPTPEGVSKIVAGIGPSVLDLTNRVAGAE